MAKSSGRHAGKLPTKAAVASQGSQTQDKKKLKKRSSTMGTGMMFRSAIKRIAREVSPDNAVMLTGNSIQILCAIAYDLVETVAGISGEMARKVGKQTVGSEDVSSAFGILLKGELRAIAVNEIKSVLAKSKVKARGK
jgi:histone H2B